MNIKELRKRVKYLIIESEYDCQGGQNRLAKELKINHCQVSMALTGLRETQRSVDILEKIKNHLLNLPIR